MIKKIYAYGDSFTAGDGVKKEDAWPQLLANIMDLEVVNRGVPGGSNKLSVIHLLNDFAAIDNPEETLVLFSWTGIMRTAVYHKGMKSWQNILVGHDPQDPDLKALHDAWYGLLYNDYDGQLDFYSQQIFVSSFLESKNVKYAFINSFVENYIDKIAFAEQYNNIIKLLPKDKFVLGYDRSIYDIVCSVLNMRCADDYHPSEEGHAYVAAEFYKFIKDNNIV